jgi:Cytochrome c554 and c-prime
MSAAVLAPAQAGVRDWVGSAVCARCHPQQWEAWRATAHARPFELQRRAQARCLACHSTGESPAGPVIEGDVGCEACHGAGAAYAADDIMRNRRLALDLGLADLSASSSPSGALTGRAAVCATCHSEVTLRPLDPARLSQPAHPRREVAP